MNISFSTQNLTLRALQNQDKDFYCSLYMTPAVMTYIDEPLTLEQAKDSFKASLSMLTQTPCPRYTWHISTKQQQLPLGICVLVKNPDKKASYEVGIMLGKQRGEGLGVELLTELANFGFKQLNLQEVTGFARLDNIASKRILEKAHYQVTVVESENSLLPIGVHGIKHPIEFN